MVISLASSGFVFWWVFGSLLCQILAAAVAGFALAAKSLKFLEIAIVTYWLIVGILQWRLLKPYIPWAYQWGLVTIVGGILSSWLILTLFVSFLPSELPREERPSAAEAVLVLFAIILVGGVPSVHFGTPTAADGIANAIAVVQSIGILAGIPSVIGILAGFLQWLLLKWHTPHAAVWVAFGSLAWLIVPVALLAIVPGGHELGFLVSPIAILIAAVLGSVIQGKALIASLQALPMAEYPTSSLAPWKALAETGGIVIAIAALLYPFRYPILRSLGFTRALNDALVSGKIDAKAYLSQGGDPNYQDTDLVDKRSLLHMAALKNNVSLAETLLERGADPNIRDKNGQTPLYKAQSPEFAELLITHKADVNTQDKVGLTPLHYTNSITVAKALIDLGANINARDNKGRTALHLQRISGKEEEIFKLILERGADVNAQDNQGLTPLQAMASWRVNGSLRQDKQLEALEFRLKLARLLIKYGADVNAQDSKGLTPVHRVESLDLARVLIENGANINMRDREGKTPLHTAAEKHLEIGIAKLLLEQGADINTQDKQGKTPLHAASQASQTQVVELLLEQGAEINAKDNLGRTALHYARRPEESIELLINAGADVNARDQEGKTPLYYAVEAAFPWPGEKVELLINRGADVNVRDNKGQTLIDVVNSKRVFNHRDFEKKKQFINFLRSHGAT